MLIDVLHFYLINILFGLFIYLFLTEKKNRSERKIIYIYILGVTKRSNWSNISRNTLRIEK